MFKAEHGIVKFFDDRSGKQYGFIRVLDADGKETGEEIFFHFNDGELIETVFMGEIGFRGCASDEIGGQRITIDKPRKGDKIYFFRRRGQGGKSKACPWGAGNQNYLWGINGYHPTVSEIFDGAGVPVPDEPTYFFEEEDLSSIEEDCLVEEDEDPASLSMVHHRISQWAGGNHELAREAAQMYPGDFI